MQMEYLWTQILHLYRWCGQKKCRSLVIFFIEREINLMCHVVCQQTSYAIRAATVLTDSISNSDSGKKERREEKGNGSVLVSVSLGVCILVFSVSKLMVAQCCLSFFTLSYSFENINKFDRLIRINRPNIQNYTHTQHTLTQRWEFCILPLIRTQQKENPYFISALYMFYFAVADCSQAVVESVNGSCENMLVCDLTR